MSESAGGRHSSDSQIAFYRSAALWFLPWVIVGVVAIGALWIAIDALGNDAAPDVDSPKKDKAPVAAANTPTEEPTEEEVDPEATETPESNEGKGKSDKDKADKAELITDGFSVQVLNGTDDSSFDDHWADKLKALGFEIEAVNPYLTAKETVVYWSTSEAQEAAEALGERFDWPVEEKPSELSAEVSIHVYLGEDEL